MYATPSDNYWLVLDQPDDVRWSSASVAYVADSDATYVAWLAAGFETSIITTEQELADLLNATYPAGSPIPIPPVYPTPGGNGPIYQDIIKAGTTTMLLEPFHRFEEKTPLTSVPRIAPYNREALDLDKMDGIAPFAALSGNITVPAGVYRLVLTGQAAGGGGGSIGGTSGPGQGGPGGPGETRRVILNVQPGDVIPYSIGAEGAGGVGNNPGQTAGDLLIGSGPPPFPVVAANATTLDLTLNLTANVNLPAGIVAGDLLFIFASLTGGGSTQPAVIVPPAGWTAIGQAALGSSTRTTVLWKTATGAEGATVAITTNIATVRSSLAIRITGHDPSGAAAILLAAVGDGGTENKSPNPPSLTATWGVRSTLWLAVGSVSANVAISGLPSGFENPLGPVQGVRLATQGNKATVINPTAFTSGIVSSWVGYTLAILPLTPASILVCKGGLGGNGNPGGTTNGAAAAPPAGSGGIRIEPTALGNNLSQAGATWGFGGSCIYGSGRFSFIANGGVSGVNGGGFGSGGGSGMHISTQTGLSGGAGGPGMILIEGYGLDVGST